MEIDNTLEVINSRLDGAEDQISDLENKVGKKKPTQTEQQKGKRILKNEESLRNILDNIKYNNICIMGIPGEESDYAIKNLFEETRTKNVPNLMKEKVTQIQEVQRAPNKLDSKNPTPRHIIIKTIRCKDKDRILKAAREKQGVTYKGAPIRLPSDYSTETFQARGSGVKYSM